MPSGDTLVVAWQTEDIPARFEVSYGPAKAYGQTATVAVCKRITGGVGKGAATDVQLAQSAGDVWHRRLSYSALLTGLKAGETCHYRVSGNGRIIAEGYAPARKPRGQKVRFAAFGDNSTGDLSDRTIAYLAYQARPDFVMNVGDNVYDRGLDSEYARYFFASYNADIPDSRLGAPLLRSVRYYTILGNHDVHNSNGAHFNDARDSLGYYTSMHLPLNGPEAVTDPTPLLGDVPDVIAQFRQAAGGQYPRMANYSYDYGDAHFLCLDSNLYVDPTDPSLIAWIEKDLAATDALWKFAALHHSPFNVGRSHYREQHMRVLSPLFEKHGVDLVFAGHEHTYQRTRPLRFCPTDIAKASVTNSSDRRVPGVFTVDRAFDGEKNTRADGIIYLTTGAGGKDLHDIEFSGDPDELVYPDDNNVAYVAQFASRYHSLTVIDLDGPSLRLTQTDELGREIDHVQITKKV